MKHWKDWSPWRRIPRSPWRKNKG